MKSTFSGLGAHILVDVLLINNQSPRDIEKETGIILARLEDIEYRIPMSCLKKLADMAYDITGDPALGLRLANDYVDQPNHLLNYLMLSCSTLLEGYQYLSRYFKIAADFSRVDLREEGENIAATYSNFSGYQAVWIIELHLTAILKYCRSFGREDINPVEIRLTYPAPDYQAEYGPIFGSPVLFDMNETAFVISKKDLLTPVTTANASLKRILIKQADELLSGMTHLGDFRTKVEQYIETHLSEGIVDVAAVSASMAMDRSTLRRKLKKEGTSFSELLEKQRRNLALQYLRQEVSVNDISDRLGFSDPSSFQHAFKRWYGHSPRADYKTVLQK